MNPSAIDVETASSLARSLEREGHVWLDMAAPEVEALARRLGPIRSHRDSASGGATHIRPRQGKISAGAAFTRDALPPHTDGSSVMHPADLVVNHCVRAGSGGEVLLVDGQLVFRALAATRHDVVRHLEMPYYAFGEARLRAAVFSCHPARATCMVRYRNDGLLAPMNRRAQQALQVLDTYIQMHTQSRPLSTGEVYIVDNTRFLHGRTTFSGDREVVRYLVDSPSLRLGIRPADRR